MPIRLRLPFASEWKRQDLGNTLRLEHDGEDCQLAVRIWPTARITTVQQCRDELRLIAPLPPAAQILEPPTADAPQSGVIAREAFEPGSDFHGWLVAATANSPSSARIRGDVVGVAAGIGRCVAVVAETSSEAAGGEQRVAERLAWLVEGVAKSITVLSVARRID
ncbi:MAG TPA: hypothetical protein VIV60_19610 [Polyangiaceae bacterium]